MSILAQNNDFYHFRETAQNSDVAFVLVDFGNNIYKNFTFDLLIDECPVNSELLFHIQISNFIFRENAFAKK